MSGFVSFTKTLLAGTLLSILSRPLLAQTSPQTPDMPHKFDTPTSSYDYEKRNVMIPMRDGIRLFTVIVVPKRAHNVPILFTRTPYDAAGRAARSDSPDMLSTLPQGDEVFVADGYIRVFQDIRGKYGSEGEYFMTRPLRGPLNSSTTDESTDAQTRTTPSNGL